MEELEIKLTEVKLSVKDLPSLKELLLDNNNFSIWSDNNLIYGKLLDSYWHNPSHKVSHTEVSIKLIVNKVTKWINNNRNVILYQYAN